MISSQGMKSTTRVAVSVQPAASVNSIYENQPEQQEQKKHNWHVKPGFKNLLPQHGEIAHHMFAIMALSYL